MTQHWIFGYGSIIWKQDFPFEQRLDGWVLGWRRRFSQSSEDHRGTPALPGRVVTMIPAPRRPLASVKGAAFKLPQDRAQAILSQLDARETGGYERVSVTVHHHDGQAIQALTYVGLPGNPFYVSGEPVAQIASRISQAHGPSGPNEEYLFKLERALRGMDAHPEDHVFQVAKAYRELSQVP